MKLVYLWIEKYCGFEKCDINLGGKYKFSFNHETFELTVSENPNYINEKKFYSSNKNSCIDCISCISGENGAGKSNLLNIIKEYVACKTLKKHIENKLLAIWDDSLDCEEQNEYYYDYQDNTPQKPKDKKETTNDITIKLIDKSLAIKLKKLTSSQKNTYVVFYSNFIDESIPQEPITDGLDYENISSNAILSKIYNESLNKNNSNLDIISVYKAHEIQSKLLFFFSICQKTDNVDIDFKSDLNNIISFRKSIVLKPIELVFNKYQKQYKNFFSKSEFKNGFEVINEVNNWCKNKLNDLKTKIPTIYSKNSNPNILLYYKWLFAYNYWINLLNYLTKFCSQKTYALNFEYLTNLTKTVVAKPIDLLNKTIESFNISKLKTENKKSDKPFCLEDKIKSFENFLEEIKDEFVIIELLPQLFLQNGFQINIQQNNKLASKIITLYTDSLIPIAGNNFIEFGWSPNLSSGESSLVTLLSRLNIVLENQKENDNDILLLLDEADIGFHPQWQKNYINSLITYLNLFCNNLDKTKNIQVIVTTNNPISLSDILPYNTIFIKDRKIISDKLNNFAADILTLFSDSFFIQDGLIGKYANNKISEIIKYSKRLDKNKDLSEFNNMHNYYKNISENIGDNYIKHYLIALLERKKRYFDDNNTQ